MPTPPDGWSGVQPAEVRTRYPGVIAFDDDQLTVWISDAEDAIYTAFPDIVERLEQGKVSPRTIGRVIARMVIRLVRNPTGVRTIQQGGGPFSGSTTFAGDHPGEVYLTAEDRDDLAGDSAPSGRRAFGYSPKLRSRW